MDTANVVVIGAGQAGLCVARALAMRGVEAVVLERARVAQAWRDRWDSFTLVTPNWTLGLPGLAYEGSEPEGHVDRDTIVAYLERYASAQPVPIREGISVDRLRWVDDWYRLSTTAGEFRARTVVVCTGSFRKPHHPAEFGSTGVTAIDSLGYHNPDQLPGGAILVVGSGQTGCQLAEELVLSGREVYLSCGRAPWVPRRVGELDIVTWLAQTDFFDLPLQDLPSPLARLGANVQATGAGGGHDLHYRTLQALGVTLTGHVEATEGTHARFADDLTASVAFGDARAAEIRELLKRVPGIPQDAPGLADPAPFHAVPPTELDLSGFGAIITTSGFRPDYARWVDLPVFDQWGFAKTDEHCAAGPGLYFCGVHFLRTRSSALLFGVGRDAELIAADIASPP